MAYNDLIHGSGQSCVRFVCCDGRGCLQRRQIGQSSDQPVSRLCASSSRLLCITMQCAWVAHNIMKPMWSSKPPRLLAKPCREVRFESNPRYTPQVDSNQAAVPLDSAFGIAVTETLTVTVEILQSTQGGLLTPKLKWAS